MKLFSTIVIVVVAAAVVAGFFIVGSPQEARRRAFDERRVQDLQIIQSHIINFWQSKEQLPSSLAELDDPTRGVKVPLDPATGAAYRYETRGELSFVLCAVFDRPSAPADGPRPLYPEPAPDRGGLDSWEHGSGEACFERTIDPDFFPPTNRPPPIKGR